MFQNRTGINSNPPREVQLTPFSKSCLLWLVSSLTVIGFLSLSIFAFYSATLPILADHYGLPARATVSEKWVYNGGVKNGISLRLRLSYNERSVEKTVSTNVYKSLQPGQELDIRYLSWAPQFPSLDMDRLSESDLYFQFSLLSLFGLVGPSFFIYIYLLSRKQKYLLINGKTVVAKIINSQKNNHKYEFEAENQIWKGKVKIITGVLYKERKEVSVLFESGLRTKRPFNSLPIWIKVS